MAYFKNIGKIKFEGRNSDNPLSFKYYNAQQIVAGKTMAEHFKFAVAYWHTFCGLGIDPFGFATQFYPWNQAKDFKTKAFHKADAAFEFLDKIGFDYLCFHDFDLIEEGPTQLESEKRLETISDYILDHLEESHKKVLWGTANCFSNPIYMNGAATNPDFSVVARVGAQLKMALDITIKLGGENYVFWGGREGYMSLLNTDVSKELDHLGILLTMAKDYARKQGFRGTFFIEPKPMEPMKHQYDFDASTTIGFIKKYGLEKDFKLNIEINHATLAQHSFDHELAIATSENMLGSIDANRGDDQNGWDTDQFPNNINELTRTMLIILQAGGFQGGGINFDAKLRRNSTDLEDLFHAHIGGADVFARALLIADSILQNGQYQKHREQRYASFDTKEGRKFRAKELVLEDLYAIATSNPPPKSISGKQEMLENLINRFI
ncbi:MAG: xylose isomerase [Flavobacteriaceae bacterium]|nr:xylose isomerase [Flavobacteriaceae bacterium]